MSPSDIARSLKGKRYDLPLHRGSGGQLVTWIIGVMTYLCVLLMVLVFALNMVQHHWQDSLSGRMTVEIPHNKNATEQQQKTDQLVDELNKLQGVTAQPLSLDDMVKLVGPWLGDEASLDDLPLPKLIDLELENNDATASIETISSTIDKIIPEASLDTHQEWLEDLKRLAKACGMILIAISIVLAMTSAVTVAATARTRLALHKKEVALLHLIGATDAYIARQFQRQAFRLATEGAAGGLVLALVTMAIIGFIKSRLGDTIVPTIDLGFMEWLCLIITPLIAGLIAMFASRFAVLHTLKRMP